MLKSKKYRLTLKKASKGFHYLIECSDIEKEHDWKSISSVHRNKGEGDGCFEARAIKEFDKQMEIEEENKRLFEENLNPKVIKTALV